LATIVSPRGRILVPEWLPKQVPNSVRQACADIVFEDMPGLPEADPAWGEPGMSKAERIFAWTSVIVLASLAGSPDAPVNAVAGTARARLQVRHTVDIDAARIIPALRAHLAAQGFGQVQVQPVLERDAFPASRTDPDESWVKAVVASLATTAGRAPNVIPNSSGSNPSQIFSRLLKIDGGLAPGYDSLVPAGLEGRCGEMTLRLDRCSATLISRSGFARITRCG
jgi:hypothetical protein